MIDKEIIQEEFDEYMVKHGYNKTQACKALEINQRTLDRVFAGKRVKTTTTNKLKNAGFTVRIKKINIVQ